jgi:hypothetical protein
MRFHLFCVSILAPFLFFFSLSFFSRTLLLLERDSTHWNFLGESLGKYDQSWDKE